MRLGILLNWRQALLTTVLVLVMFTPNSSQCEAGLWIEQGRYPPVSYQMVLVKSPLPTWLVRLKACFRHWQVSQKIFVRLLCQFLASILFVWLNILTWLIQQMLTNSKISLAGPIQGDYFWSRPVYGATLEVKMAVSLIPTMTQRGVIVEEGPVIDVKQLNKSFNTMIVSQEKHPLVTHQVNSSDTNQELYENQIDVERGDCEQTTSVCEVAEQQNNYSITETSGKIKASYGAAVEHAMINFYQSLNEKDRRRYAAVEAIKLGHGGQSVIAKILDLSRKTIAKGIKEIKGDLIKEGRIRKKGAGRKSYTHHYPDIDEKFLDVLKHYIAGNPMKEDVLWTNLSQAKIADLLHEKHGIKVSTTVIKQLLKKNNFRRRKAQKRRTMKQVALRNEQFENIARLRAEYEAAGNPVISMDTKKKEHLGNYYRDGYLYTREEVQTWDHDFKNIAEGIIVPHGLYDGVKSKSHITIGTSKDTSEFATESFKLWWNKYGKNDYPDATSILILCDGGGSNSSRHYIFKEDLQKLANEIGIEIRIAHYPPYCSKYNPIEHRLFPHVTRACQGVILRTHQIAKELMEKTSTKTGLTTTVDILDKTYETGRKYAKDFRENMPIIFDSYLERWNYRAVPNG